jgi:hypothetical protein
MLRAFRHAWTRRALALAEGEAADLPPRPCAGLQPTQSRDLDRMKRSWWRLLSFLTSRYVI